MTKTVVLTFLNGTNRDQTIAVSRGKELVVGRAVSCDHAVMDPRMSRKHFLISDQNGVWYVDDQQSSNGTKVNDHTVGRAAILEGDVISCGDTRIRVTLSDQDLPYEFGGTAVERTNRSEQPKQAGEKTTMD